MGAPLIVWRHPRPPGAAGRCIGHTDLAVDHRKAKRLAHRIRTTARRAGWARVVITSPLQRCASVGRWLARWGWQHRVDDRLAELNFGTWEGQTWSHIGAASIEAWTNDFTEHAPGGGESLRELIARCRAFLADCGDEPVLVVGHAGWVNAARWVVAGRNGTMAAAEWPTVLRYGAAESFFKSSGGAASQ